MTAPGGGPGQTAQGPNVSPRVVIAGIALILALIFIFQNTNKVKITFLFFDVTTSAWVGFLVSLVLGALLGQAVGAVVRRRRRAED